MSNTMKDKAATAGHAVGDAAKIVGHKIAEGAEKAADFVKEKTGIGHTEGCDAGVARIKVMGRIGVWPLSNVVHDYQRCTAERELAVGRDLCRHHDDVRMTDPDLVAFPQQLRLMDTSPVEKGAIG